MQFYHDSLQIKNQFSIELPQKKWPNFNFLTNVP